MNKISVMIVDDHKLFRELWSEMLNINGGFIIVAETGDCAEAISLAGKLKPAVVLMDISMQPLSGLEVTEKIRRLYPAVRVIGLSMHSNQETARKMLQGGASGYMTKNSTSEELIEAITLVAKGQQYICAEVKELISSQYLQGIRQVPQLEMLTEREMEVAQCVREGLSSKEIAEDLGLSSKTVEVHRHNILKKLNLKNAPELCDFLHRNSVEILPH